ncbi:MAG: FMN-binding glutamate synthase family protein [Gammaproteobacteria bacterium]|nr:FMN-binding glutamate synthase family protein [Gammaproteobacteria bacterium]
MADYGLSVWILGLQVFAVGVLAMLVMGVLAVLWMYVHDVRQKRHAILHNFPVIGRFRYCFERLGHFFRQYFFAMDREEMPFNRAQRSWVYRAAKNVDSTLAFGSTANLAAPGAVLFVPEVFPTLEEDAVMAGPLLIGPHCANPYRARSFFNVSALSYGAISKVATLALSGGAARAGCWLNTGEGGLSPYHLDGGCDLVFQIGTAKYGVRDAQGRLSDERLRELAAHQQIKMFELKLSQGAKPGKGGILPGIKVTEEVAHIRGIPVGHDSISPNGHPEVRNVAQLLDMIAHIRAVTGKPVGFKLVIGGTGFLDELCLEVLRRGPEGAAPDFITLDSGDGGSGAAPQSLMDHAGLGIRESLPAVVDTLREYGLRERIRVIAAGKLILPVDVAWALCVGADFVVSARGFMFALGCIQAMQCNRNTCPTGVTTHNPDLQRGLDPADKAARVAHYVANLVREVGVIAHSCGVRSPRDLQRRHARIVTEFGQSEPLDRYYAKAAAQNPVFPR